MECRSEVVAVHHVRLFLLVEDLEDFTDHRVEQSGKSNSRARNPPDPGRAARGGEEEPRDLPRVVGAIVGNDPSPAVGLRIEGSNRQGPSEIPEVRKAVGLVNVANGALPASQRREGQGTSPSRTGSARWPRGRRSPKPARQSSGGRPAPRSLRAPPAGAG